MLPLKYSTANARTFNCLFRINSVRLDKNLIMGTIRKDKARFDTRLPLEQKQLFERAAILGGYRNLTDFVVVTVQSKAKEIIEERERIIATQKDNEIFFNFLVNPPKPNNDLLSAKAEYVKLISK
jgi:uncharacterized protein (DUF1778 family)